jgi:hypothetical protein
MDNTALKQNVRYELDGVINKLNDLAEWTASRKTEDTLNDCVFHVGRARKIVTDYLEKEEEAFMEKMLDLCLDVWSFLTENPNELLRSRWLDGGREQRKNYATRIYNKVKEYRAEKENENDHVAE